MLGAVIVATSASAASAQTIPVQQYPYISGPVTITSCSVNEKTSDSTVSPNSLRINYYSNKPGQTLTSVTFRVRYAQTPVTVTDTGSFEYKKNITHQFNLLGGLPWSGANPAICRVLSATSADGKSIDPMYEGPDAVMSPAAAPALPPAGMPAPVPSPT